MKVIDPVIVVEVRSPLTAHMDTSAKLLGDFKLPSVRHYLFIDPDAHAIMHHARSADGSVVARTIRTGSVVLDPPGLTIEAGDVLA
jgi:Uma2 family endonuclease